MRVELLNFTRDFHRTCIYYCVRAMRKNKPFKYYYYYGSFTLRTLNTLRANDFNACLHCTVDIRRDDATYIIYYRGVQNKILSRFEY